jgi:uncharacterized protein YqjF (DUF2071 family)
LDGKKTDARPDRAEHRPWPVPDEPWILKQSWNDLLFVHWPVSRDTLRETVPAYLELDTYENESWLTITPFRLTDLAPRGLPPLPWVSAFSEINVRTYVVYKGIPGIYFFSLDADSTIAVSGASTVFHLPYFVARIDVENQASHLSFRSRRVAAPAEFHVEYRPIGPAYQPELRTLDHWLTERYCVYTGDSSARAYRVEIHHPPWRLQAAEARIILNSMAARVHLPSAAAIAHFARRQDVVTWRPHALRY